MYEIAVRVMKRGRLLLVAAACLLAVAATGAAQTSFPFDREMLLDVKPLPGSRRVPIIEVRSNGRAVVDLWCHTAHADVAVAGNNFKLTFVSGQEENCTPDRYDLDKSMVAALTAITTWRRENDIVVLAGPTTTFRFRLSTH